MEFIDLKTQYKHIQPAVQARINSVLEHGKFIMGPEVGELETQLAKFTGVKHCIAVSSGTDALLIALMALGVKPGDEVITPAFSFAATAEVTALLGAKPVFVDIDPLTYNINPELIEQAITDNTKAIMAVSLYGQCAEFDEINNIAQRYNIPVIEDAAQSFGAIYKNRKSCALTHIGCTSFFPSKPLGCYGDGGACFTDDDQIAELIRAIRTHGQRGRYNHELVGVNGRIDTIQAAILLSKLEIFENEVKARVTIGARYNEQFEDLQPAVITPLIKEYNQCVYAQYTLRSTRRDHLCRILNENGIPTAIHYPMALSDQVAFVKYKTDSAQFPDAIKAAAEVFSIPMHPYLDESDQDMIISKLKSAIKNISGEKN